MSATRQPAKFLGVTQDSNTAKSTGILNAYGEIALSKENEISQANLFHKNINSTNSISMTSPKSQGSTGGGRETSEAVPFSNNQAVQSEPT